MMIILWIVFSIAYECKIQSEDGSIPLSDAA
ncbi:MAG: hypothetical protein ACI88A_003822 [Paraglaciecola sp.]|jgi:hypothetical protein